MQYAGISLTMKAGEKQMYEIACAKHLLNGFGPRGLTSLAYGADEEKIGTEARERNKEFKKRQIIEYNQRNENRKAMGLGYLPPTREVKKYAIELGLELLEPYAIREEERGALAEGKQRIAALENQLNAQNRQMAELMEKMNSLLSAQQKPEAEKQESRQYHKSMQR